MTDHFHGLNYCHTCRRILDEDSVKTKTEKLGEAWATFLYCVYCGDGNMERFDAQLMADEMTHISQGFRQDVVHQLGEQYARKHNADMIRGIIEQVFDL